MAEQRMNNSVTITNDEMTMWAGDLPSLVKHKLQSWFDDLDERGYSVRDSQLMMVQDGSLDEAVRVAVSVLVRPKSDITIQEFVKDRIEETRLKNKIIQLRYPEVWENIEFGLAALEQVLKYDSQWPVFVEKQPTWDAEFMGDLDLITMRINQQIAWMTQEEYKKKFGTDAPSSKLLRMIATQYNWHPDFNTDWLIRE